MWENFFSLGTYSFPEKICGRKRGRRKSSLALQKVRVLSEAAALLKVQRFCCWRPRRFAPRHSIFSEPIFLIAFGNPSKFSTKRKRLIFLSAVGGAAKSENKIMQKYFLYARKSTDDEERQVLSIEAQLAELREFAKKENLSVISEFVESKTAKQPGRAIFNEMLLRIELGEADGIIAWNPDRLARNAVDGGQIINLIDRGKLQSLKFPTYWFEPSSQGLFMLQIAFGQAKYYIDNLSENVKRGLRQKLRRGEWPGLVDWICHNLRTHTVEIDKEKGAIVKKLFENYATGKFTFSDLEKLSLSLGLVSNRGKRKGLPISVLQKMLSNVFYIGLFVYGGETYEGKHEPLIDKATFDRVQRILSEKSRPRKTKELINFPYRGLFICGECGKAITGERHKKIGFDFHVLPLRQKGTNCKQNICLKMNLADR